MTTTATLMAAQAAGDTATARELEDAAAAGRAAGRDEHLTGRRAPCPYPLDSLRAHVFVRWCVRARLTAAGMTPPA